MSKDERKDFYRTIAWGLNRPLFAVYRRVLRMYDDRNHVGKYENLYCACFHVTGGVVKELSIFKVNF
jgi:hypothetical protein